MKNISQHVFNLTSYLHNNLLKLHHCNGKPVVKLYRDTDYTDINTQGNIVNFNVLRSTGEYIGYFEVLNMANLHNIYLRTGCFCNPGACQRHLKLTNEQLKNNYDAGHTCAYNIDLINGYPTGSVRVSFGYMSNQEDVDRLIQMLVNCFIRLPVVIKIPAYWAEESKRLQAKFHDSANDSKYQLELSNNEKFLYTDTHKSRNHRLASSKYNMKLTKIFIYPVKSCGYYEVLTEWPLVKTGLKYDREWMITMASGVALSQMRHPKLCLIKPIIKVDDNSLTLTYTESESEIKIPLEGYENISNNKNSLSFCQSKVCNDRIEGIDCGDEVADWLCDNLNMSGLRLIKRLSRNTKPQNGEADIPLSLASKSQILLIHEATVLWFADKLKDFTFLDLSLDGPLPNMNVTSVQTSNLQKIINVAFHSEKVMIFYIILFILKLCIGCTIFVLSSIMDRFRGNFVVSGDMEANSEQTWNTVQIGTVHFKVDGPCDRCQIICINQETGIKDKEALTTLSSALNGKMRFGIYLHIDTSHCNSNLFMAKIGDTVYIDK